MIVHGNNSLQFQTQSYVLGKCLANYVAKKQKETIVSSGINVSRRTNFSMQFFIDDSVPLKLGIMSEAHKIRLLNLSII